MLIHITILVLSISLVTYIPFNNITLTMILFGFITDISLTSIATATVAGELISQDKSPHEGGVTTTSVILLSVFYSFLAPAILYMLLTLLFTTALLNKSDFG